MIVQLVPLAVDYNYVCSIIELGKREGRWDLMKVSQ